MKFENLYDNEKCLFRYRTITDHNVSALEKNRLFFSTPNNFNDPFDAYLFANVQQILNNVFESLEFGMEGYIENLKKTDSRLAFFMNQIWKSPCKEKKVEWFIGNIKSIIDIIKDEIRKNTKIVCLSNVYNSMLMWSHYANDHQGYVLMYDIDDLNSGKRFSANGKELNDKILIKKVEYVQQQVDFTDDLEGYIANNIKAFIKNSPIRDEIISKYKIRDFITQKSIEWSYENEWRIIPRIVHLEKNLC